MESRDNKASALQFLLTSHGFEAGALEVKSTFAQSKFLECNW